MKQVKNRSFILVPLLALIVLGLLAFTGMCMVRGSASRLNFLGVSVRNFLISR